MERAGDLTWMTIQVAGLGKDTLHQMMVQYKADSNETPLHAQGVLQRVAGNAWPATPWRGTLWAATGRAWLFGGSVEARVTSTGSFTVTLAVKGANAVRCVTLDNGAGSAEVASGEEASLVVVNTPKTPLQYNRFELENKGMDTDWIGGSPSAPQDPKDYGRLYMTWYNINNRDDILVFSNQIAEVWHMASCYAARPVDPSTPPPWKSESDYSHIMSRHLDIDSRVPAKYRWHENKDFQDREPAELHEQRGYWGPWLFGQFIYAAIPCLLNHPFLLSMRLRNFRHTMPQSFIQQSFEQIMRHAGWIIYFLDLLESKSFQVSDPILGQCVAIIATIQLQHSFVRNDTLRARAQSGFEKCMSFLRKLGRVWPNIGVTVEKLQRLQQSIVVVVDASVSQEDDHPPEGRKAQTWSIDAALLWEILVYEKAGSSSLSENLSSVFGDSLLPSSSTPEMAAQDIGTEFDLIGSEGIAGHKTVLKETPLHAPGQDVTLLDSISPLQGPISARDVAPRETSPTFLEAMGVTHGQQNFFLGADAYNRTIDAWLDLGVVT
ncbi:hypothetical protein diail_6307 [Diaporthe ilicicola]|nr:hypothetical protein diail_6307 [Diaporthe ilicicola]